jgi:hypothetical protein
VHCHPKTPQKSTSPEKEEIVEGRRRGKEYKLIETEDAYEEIHIHLLLCLEPFASSPSFLSFASFPFSTTFSFLLEGGGVFLLFCICLVQGVPYKGSRSGCEVDPNKMERSCMLAQLKPAYHSVSVSIMSSRS